MGLVLKYGDFSGMAVCGGCVGLEGLLVRLMVCVRCYFSYGVRVAVGEDWCLGEMQRIGGEISGILFAVRDRYVYQFPVVYLEVMRLVDAVYFQSGRACLEIGGRVDFVVGSLGCG